MRYGIAQQLFLAFVLVIIVSVGSVVGVVYAGTDQEIGLYEQRLSRLELTRMEHWLVGAYRHEGGAIGFQPIIEEFAVLYGRNIVVTDRDGSIVADSRNERDGDEFRRVWLQHELHLARDTEPFGTIYLNGSGQSVATLFREQLASALTRLLMWGGILSLLLALPLALLVAHPITRAIREISVSASRAGSGDLASRVAGTYRGELGHLATAFNTMILDLERAAVQRRNMVADTAHEVRTPISNIKGYVEAVTDGLVSTEIAMRAIGDETTQLTHLADDLQELALADAGSLSLVRCPESVEDLIDHAATNARARMTSLGMTMIAEIDPDLPLVLVDSQRIVQVFNNLLNNAASYSLPGSTITVKASPRGSSTSGTTDVVIAVSDRGCGIPHEELENIFERFDRVDPSRVRSTGGSGLGLTIARSIIEAHGGSIHAENRDGGGSNLVFTLPVIT